MCRRALLRDVEYRLGRVTLRRPRTSRPRKCCIRRYTPRPAVQTEAACPAGRLARQDQINNCGCKRTENLSDGVADEVAFVDPSRRQNAETDGGVHVTSRYRAAAIGHRDEGAAECARNLQHFDGCGATAYADDDCAAAAERDECECTDELVGELFHRVCPPVFMVTTYWRGVSSYRGTRGTVFTPERRRVCRPI